MSAEDLFELELTLEGKRRLSDLVMITIPRGVGTEIETDDTRIY